MVYGGMPTCGHKRLRLAGCCLVKFLCPARSHPVCSRLICSQSAVRGHVASSAGLLPSAQVRHRNPHGSRHHPRHPRGDVYRTHAHEVCSQAEAESIVTVCCFLEIILTFDILRLFCVASECCGLLLFCSLVERWCSDCNNIVGGSLFTTM